MADSGEWDLAPTSTYVEGLREGQLRFLRCRSCSAVIFFPRVLCPQCGSASLGWESSAGMGAVYSVTEVPQADGGTYNICLVDVDEGFRLVTTVLRTTPSIGARVEFAPGPSSDGDPHPVFVVSEKAVE